MLTMVAQIMAAAHRDLYSCIRTNDLRSQSKNQVGLTYFSGQNPLPQPEKRGSEEAYLSKLNLPAALTFCEWPMFVSTEYPWSKDLHDVTGFTVRALSKCVLHLHKKWY